MWTEAHTSRRRLLLGACQGAGALALAGLLRPEHATAAAAIDPLAPRLPHFAPRAKRCIFLFMAGGVSHVDTFEYKPELAGRPGQRVPSIPNVDGEIASFLRTETSIIAPVYPFQPFGDSGRMMCGLFENLGPRVDDLAFIHGIEVDANNHAPATMHINTGSTFQGHPSVGAWVSYGLGTENQDLPSYVVMHDPRGLPINGPAIWSSGFLPAAYQGTPLRPDGPPILNLQLPEGMSQPRAQRSLELLSSLNRHHARSRTYTDDLESRIASYELAFRMQMRTPELLDLSGESPATRETYGLDQPTTSHFGRQCLLARRLVERGVRFVTLVHGVENGPLSWDHHGNLKRGLRDRIAEVDRPVAALLGDLSQRGLLEETLVVWTSEMGRTPFAQVAADGVGPPVEDGRDHNQYALVTWLAGAGVRRGASVGQTDPFGVRGIGAPIRVRDLHATILHLMGLEDSALTFLHEGRHHRLTDEGGHVLRGVLA